MPGDRFGKAPCQPGPRGRGLTTEDTLLPQLLGRPEVKFSKWIPFLSSLFVLGCHLHPLIEIFPYIRSHWLQIVFPMALARDFQETWLMRADRCPPPRPPPRLFSLLRLLCKEPGTQRGLCRWCPEEQELLLWLKNGSLMFCVYSSQARRAGSEGRAEGIVHISSWLRFLTPCSNLWTPRDDAS